MNKNLENWIEKEKNYLCNSYTSEELAEQLLLSIEIIREKNKLLEEFNGK